MDFPSRIRYIRTTFVIVIVRCFELNLIMQFRRGESSLIYYVYAKYHRIGSYLRGVRLRRAWGFAVQEKFSAEILKLFHLFCNH